MKKFLFLAVITLTAGMTLTAYMLWSLATSITPLASIKTFIGDTITTFGPILYLTPPVVIAAVAHLGLILLVLSRMLALISQIIIAPSAFTGSYSNHSFTDTRAFRFCRDFLGLFFQCTVVILAFVVTQNLISTLIGGLVAGLFEDGVITGFDVKIVYFLSALKIIQTVIVIGLAQLSKKVFGELKGSDGENGFSTTYCGCSIFTGDPS